VSVEDNKQIIALQAHKAHTSTASQKEHLFLSEFLKGSDKALARPFSTPHWPLAIPALVCTVALVLLSTRVINLGILTLNWTLSFNVNIAIALAIVLTGVVIFLNKVRTNLKELRSATTLISLGMVALLTALFLSPILNLGTFLYTLETLEVNVILGLLLVIALVALAFRGSRIATGILVILFIWWGVSIKDFNIFIMFRDLFTSENGGRLVRSLMPPNWKYFSHVIDPLFITIQTAIASTIIGMLGALPLSFLAARNTTPHPIIYHTVRLVINSLRAVPALILALLFIPFVGLGPGAGILGLGLHTISALTKLYAEAIEAVKPQPIEALSAIGANGLKRFRWGVFPQAFPLLASYTIYSWESNLRDSTVVAFVGGGGIGFLLQANLSLLDYANVAVMLVVLVLAVSLLDRLSDFIRAKII
jgi:phosphonate ABC transporter permease subunit PhnE